MGGRHRAGALCLDDLNRRPRPLTAAAVAATTRTTPAIATAAIASAAIAAALTATALAAAAVSPTLTTRPTGAAT